MSSRTGSEQEGTRVRIVILADSLARPRPDLPAPDRTEYEDVYGFLLKQAFPCPDDVELCYVESLDSEDAIFWSQRMVAFREPDVVVYHLGVNDCAPRMFRKGSRSLLLRPWFQKVTGNVFLRGLRRFRRPITRRFPKTYVDPERFRQNFADMIAEVRAYSPSARFFAVGISEVSDGLAYRSFGYNENVRRYNQILSEVFGAGFVNPNDLLPTDERLISDGVHFTKKAHRLVASELERRISESSSLPGGLDG